MKSGPGGLGVSHQNFLQFIPQSDLCSDLSANRPKPLPKIKLRECEECQAPTVVRVALSCTSPLLIIILMVTESSSWVLLPQKLVLHHCLGGLNWQGTDHIQRQ
jgi:hypothetical protein